MNEDNQKLSELIASALKSKRISQKEFASMLNTSQPVVSSWCKGKKVPSGRTLLDIAKILGIECELFPHIRENLHFCRKKLQILMEIAVGNDDFESVLLVGEIIDAVSELINREQNGEAQKKEKLSTWKVDGMSRAFLMDYQMTKDKLSRIEAEIEKIKEQNIEESAQIQRRTGSKAVCTKR